MAKVELVDVNACKKNLIVEIAAEEAQKEYDQMSREFARHARVPGFRPGKTPLSLVKRRFHAEIREQLVRDMVPRFYKKALEEKDLHPISEPYLENVEFEEGSAFKFQAVFEILPPLHIDGYKGMRISAQPRAIDEEEIRKALESLQEQHAKFLPIDDRASKLGDYVAVNLKGKLADGSGVEFQDKNIIVHLGNADTVSGFTENLSGVLPGDHRAFTVQYAQDFRNPRLAGKGVEYEASVVAVKEKRLPDIDDELAKEAGDYAGLEELRKAVSRKLEEQASREFDSKVREELMGQLLSKNSIEVPEILVEEELKRVFQRLAEEFSSQGIDPTHAKIDWKAVAEENRPRAMELAKQKLALTAVADQESIQIADEELEVEIGKLADMAHRTPDAMRATLAKDGRLEELRQNLRKRKALELIRSQAIS